MFSVGSSGSIMSVPAHYYTESDLQTKHQSFNISHPWNPSLSTPSAVRRRHQQSRGCRPILARFGTQRSRTTGRDPRSVLGGLCPGLDSDWGLGAGKAGHKDRSGRGQFRHCIVGKATKVQKDMSGGYILLLSWKPEFVYCDGIHGLTFDRTGRICSTCAHML